MLAQKLIRSEFIAYFGDNELEYFFSPGRVNLIGEHIDYNGGYVLPASISLGVSAVVSRNSTDYIRIYSMDFKEELLISIHEFEYQSNLLKTDIHWSDYIKSMLQVLKDKGVVLKGAAILLGSDLPIGSGLSSSAAIECLIAYIFNSTFYNENRKQLALDAQYAESHYVGVNCGIMDQFAVANGKSNKAMLLNCASLEFEYIDVNFKDYQLLIINSNKSRALAESKYNERRKECDQAFSVLQKMDPAGNLCQVHEISLAMLEDDVLYRRAKHVILENKRVQYAVDALEHGNIEVFGQLLTDSHKSLDIDYEVSGEELNTIVHYSSHFEGCAGARMTGAGFGGCCIALVKKESVDKLIPYVAKKYFEKTGLNADFYHVDIVDGVNSIKFV